MPHIRLRKRLDKDPGRGIVYFMLSPRRFVALKAAGALALAVFLVAVGWPHLHTDSDADDSDCVCSACQLQENLAAVVPASPILAPIVRFIEQPVIELPADPKVFRFIRAAGPRAPPVLADRYFPWIFIG